MYNIYSASVSLVSVVVIQTTPSCFYFLHGYAISYYYACYVIIIYNTRYNMFICVYSVASVY